MQEIINDRIFYLHQNITNVSRILGNTLDLIEQGKYSTQIKKTLLNKLLIEVESLKESVDYSMEKAGDINREAVK